MKPYRNFKIGSWLSLYLFIYLIIDIQATESWAGARHYVLRHLRWKYSGRVLKAYVLHKSSLAQSIFELLRKLNGGTRFEAHQHFETMLDNISTNYQDLKKSEQGLIITEPEGLSSKNEVRTCRYESSDKMGQVRFYQPTENTLYILFAGRVSTDLFNYMVSTCRGLAKNIRSRYERYAIMVDFTHEIQIDKSLLFSTYKYGLEKGEGRSLYLIGPTNPTRFIRWASLLIRQFFKKAHPTKDYPSAHNHFTTGAKTSSQSFVHNQVTKQEEISKLKELCEQQQNLLAKQSDNHEQELNQLQQIIWKLLLKESNAPIVVDIPEEEGTYTESLQMLDTFQKDQALFVQELQKQIDERTRAEQIAAEANDIKGKFLASMSHEIRTPLNAILGFTRVLQIKDHENLSQAQQIYLQRIQENGNNLLHLINDVLDLSHLETGKMSLDIHKIELHTLVKDIARQIDILAHNKGLSIQMELSECCLYTDEKRLRQIIVNLLNNAIKYTQKGYIRILCESENGKAIALHVQDTGDGILEVHKNTIFSAFEQVNVHSEGAGLGLAISSTLAKHLEHRLTFESTFGKGSTFSLYF